MQDREIILRFLAAESFNSSEAQTISYSKDKSGSKSGKGSRGGKLQTSFTSFNNIGQKK